MYKVFINEKTIYFTKKTVYTESESTMIHKYISIKELEDIFFKFKDSESKQILIVYGKRKTKLLNKFISIFKYIEAAGGLVKNPNNEYLFIFRRGKWDLPKGKIDALETTKKAALREVEEECSVQNLKIKKSLPPTYHIYYFKEKWILKKTYWYEMLTNSTELPVPQTEEDITEARWVKKREVEHLMELTYRSIFELVSFYFSLKRK